MLPVSMLFCALFARAATPEFRLERVPVAGGAELITVLAPSETKTGEVPLLTVLRDTLGDSDPGNDRLRSIWILTAGNPSLLQRAAGAIPFFYFRPNLGKNAGKTPGPVLDMGDTNSIVWSSLAQSLTQVMAIDSTGAMIRASSRRYRTNVADRRRVHLMEGLAVLSSLEGQNAQSDLSDGDLLNIQARLMLAGQTLGGLVTEDKLPDAYFSRREQIHERRGHNWELLRQIAERNGLYFDPMGLGDSQTHALLWIARDDARMPRKFDGQFLDIRNPYGDDRVRNWQGVSATRFYDAQGREVPQGTPGATKRELIPLALYGLDYPKVPLLLIDFRDTHAPKRREMLGRAASDIITGILGVSRWGNWPYLAGTWTWNFARTRKGVPTNGSDRLEAYASVRRFLALDHALDPELRAELQHRLEGMGVNPLQESVEDGNKFARRQYQALLKYAADPKGLPARLEKDRAYELVEYEHRPIARFGLTAARIVTLGIFKHREPEKGADLVAAIDQKRNATREMRFLDKVIASPQPELVWNMEEVRKALDSLNQGDRESIERALTTFHVDIHADEE